MIAISRFSLLYYRRPTRRAAAESVKRGEKPLFCAWLTSVGVIHCQESYA